MKPFIPRFQYWSTLINRIGFWGSQYDITSIIYADIGADIDDIDLKTIGWYQYVYQDLIHALFDIFGFLYRLLLFI